MQDPSSPAALQSLIPILPVQSVARAVAFFTSMGFTARLYGQGDDYAFLFRDDLELHVRRAPDLVPRISCRGRTRQVYLRLRLGTAAHLQAEFLSRGVPTLSALQFRDWGMYEFMVSEPDGNLLRFGEQNP